MKQTVGPLLLAAGLFFLCAVNEAVNEIKRLDAKGVEDKEIHAVARCQNKGKPCYEFECCYGLRCACPDSKRRRNCKCEVDPEAEELQWEYF